MQTDCTDYSETGYGEGMSYTGTYFVGVADSQYGGKGDAGDYMATVGLNDGSGWRGLRTDTAGVATRYDYDSGSVEYEVADHAHPSGLTTSISHLFFADKPVCRIWTSCCGFCAGGPQPRSWEPMSVMSADRPHPAR